MEEILKVQIVLTNVLLLNVMQIVLEFLKINFHAIMGEILKIQIVLAIFKINFLWIKEEILMDQIV